MNMPKKPKKTKEELTAENYFPVDKTDLKNTVEKQVKEFHSESSTIEIPEIESTQNIKISVEKSYKKIGLKEREVIEKKGSKKTKEQFSGKSKKVSKPKKSIKEFKLPEIKLKKNGYELIITEKPQAALKISSSIGNSSKKNIHGIPYYEVERNGKEIVVACAVGHLFALQQKTNGTFPIFDVIWIPKFISKKGDFTKKYYETILKLAKDASEITIATDYDIEGEVIGMNVMRFICNQKNANRMKFSTLTSKELNDSYENKSKSINWGQAIAGETRHYLDWFYGINLSRALMNSIKSVGSFKIMSIGRVQGPALDLIVKKEKEIQSFKSQTYWQIFLSVKNENKVELKHNKDIFNKNELTKFNNLIGKEAIAKTEKSEQKISPGVPFDLTSLQSEVYKFYGITPARTLQIAQSLYLAGLISYPRTSSQKLPPSIGYTEILKRISKQFDAEKFIKKTVPTEGKKSDPAHPSIYPTGEIANLDGEEKKVYDLIAKRFLALFCNDLILDNKKISVEINNLKFSTKGMAIKDKGWLEIYPAKMEEKEIPDLNGKIIISSIRNEEKQTQPPHRYSPASIITELEKRNLGTKATRANILETLYDRGYIKEKSIEATSLGISLIDTLEKYSPIIIDEKLTRHFEKEMENILNSKKDFLVKENKVIEEAKKSLIEILNQFSKNEKNIGKELIEANNTLREKERQENKLIKCPVCKKGELTIMYSKKTRRYFVACNAYPECKTTFTLPPDGLIKKTEKLCESCNYPLLMRLKKAARPWIFCFNPQCESNIKRIEEYRKKEVEE